MFIELASPEFWAFPGELKAGMGLWTEASPYMHVAAEIHEQLAKDNPTDRDCTRPVRLRPTGWPNWRFKTKTMRRSGTEQTSDSNQ